jgi:1,4-dihydroxy-2-naphthoate octaprenyltransferase
MKINPDSLNVILSTIGQIGTWVTIVLVFLTLKEMEKQRRESYKPVIVIPQFDLKAKGKCTTKLLLFISCIAAQSSRKTQK